MMNKEREEMLELCNKYMNSYKKQIQKHEKIIDCIDYLIYEIRKDIKERHNIE